MATTTDDDARTEMADKIELDEDGCCWTIAWTRSTADRVGASVAHHD
jgi:hypothetical protein